MEALHAWLTAPLERVSGQSALAEALRYALRHWPGLVLFLEDGRAELDNNTVERAIRPIALGRKNALFAGSDGGARHWAIVASLVATAKLNGIEPQAWLTDVLERMVAGRTKAPELARLLPWTWQAERRAAAVQA
jgi:transposase